ncbi:hypothetical protein [Diplocloster modestus]|uniref:Uncharacterized protein n=1 Tax=Diplocloster modestus TaxID=2850322 RepID=A0ABS6K6T4_9FIRM|nr:hypothetical protein [Diplocloster modestus]MBU9726214.1 hypothetical protein [Diplocloster modestus]
MKYYVQQSALPENKRNEAQTILGQNQEYQGFRDLFSDKDRIFTDISVYDQEGRKVHKTQGTLVLTIPYPENPGSTKDFIIFHIKDDGQVERITTFEKTDSGLKVTLDNFSTYAVSWKDASKQNQQENGNDGQDSHNTDNSAQGAQTGDHAMPAFWILCCAAALGLIIFIRKNRRLNEH